MRKGLLITVRDLTLMHYLYVGPATRKSIFTKIFEIPGSNKKTRERVMMRRLAKLTDQGLIRSTTCPTVADTIYFLTREAAPIVASNFGMDISQIWVSFNKNTIEHDLLVSACARKIIKDANEKGVFTLSFLIIESGLKEGGKMKKGLYYPDLFYGVKGSTESLNTFSLEVDCGSISRTDFLGKINCFNDRILVVTKTRKRLDLLLWYLQDEEVSKTVYLTTVKNFLGSDFLACEWNTNIFSTPVSIEIL